MAGINNEHGTLGGALGGLGETDMPHWSAVRNRGSSGRLNVVFGIFFACVVIVGIALIFDLRVNWTASMPKGLYRSVDPDYQRGEWVAICLEGDASAFARDRAYVIAGSCPEGLAAVFKQIRGVAGDRIELAESGVRINGESVSGSALKRFDSQGRPLKSAGFGTSRLLDETFWVMGIHLDQSWDSRYFGPVRKHQIVGKAVPIWTFD